MFAIVLWLAGLMFPFLTGGCRPAPTLSVQIIDHGIYSAKIQQVVAEPNSPTGQARIIETELLRQTDAIPAVLGTKFGFRFKVVGARVEATNRFRLEFTFPEMTDPRNGKVSSNYQAVGDIPAGLETGMFWDFVHPWEMRPGAWTFTISAGDRQIARKVFTVVEAEGANSAGGPRRNSGDSGKSRE